jgi:hypothetical protein
MAPKVYWGPHREWSSPFLTESCRSNFDKPFRLEVLLLLDWLVNLGIFFFSVIESFFFFTVLVLQLLQFFHSVETLFQLRLLLCVSWPDVSLATLLLNKRWATPFSVTYGVRRSQIRLYAAKRKYIMVFDVFDLSDWLSSILRYDGVLDRAVEVRSRLVIILSWSFLTQNSKAWVWQRRAVCNETTHSDRIYRRL